MSKQRDDLQSLLTKVQEFCVSKEFEKEFEDFALCHADVFADALEHKGFCFRTTVLKQFTYQTNNICRRQRRASYPVLRCVPQVSREV